MNKRRDQPGDGGGIPGGDTRRDGLDRHCMAGAGVDGLRVAAASEFAAEDGG